MPPSKSRPKSNGRGASKPAPRMTIRQFAREVGVSIGTVSRVLNRHPAVSDETRRRVLQRIEELGYEPSPTARALSTGRSQVVSVWIGNLNSRYVMAFLGQIEQRLTEVEYELLLRNLWHRPLDQPLTPIKADGIIVLDETAWVEKLQAARPRVRAPLVSMGKLWVSTVDHVGLDLSVGTRESVEHLAEAGCRRIAYVAPKVRNTPDNIQYRAYLEAVEAVGRAPEVIASPRIGDRARVEETLEAYLAGQRCPDGLVCYNDDHALAACRVLRRHGLRIPEDVAVVGCNGLLETEYLEHPLSTIVLPVAQACAEAWRLLEARMEDPDQPVQSVVLQPRLEVRDSSRRP